jgi:hypothetical protein
MQLARNTTRVKATYFACCLRHDDTIPSFACCIHRASFLQIEETVCQIAHRTQSVSLLSLPQHPCYPGFHTSPSSPTVSTGPHSLKQSRSSPKGSPVPLQPSACARVKTSQAADPAPVNVGNASGQAKEIDLAETARVSTTALCTKAQGLGRATTGVTWPHPPSQCSALNLFVSLPGTSDSLAGCDRRGLAPKPHQPRCWCSGSSKSEREESEIPCEISDLQATAIE